MTLSAHPFVTSCSLSSSSRKAMPERAHEIDTMHAVISKALICVVCGKTQGYARAGTTDWCHAVLGHGCASVAAFDH